MSVTRLKWKVWQDEFGNPMLDALYQLDQTEVKFWYGRSLDPEDDVGHPDLILAELDQAAAKVEFSNLPPRGQP